MSEMLTQDPWASVTSRNGIPADELISMLQKSIRRGNEKNALIAAYEMHISSPQLADKMWRRLLCISVEDIGFGNTEAPKTVWALYKMRQHYPYPAGDQPIFFVYAVRYLCRCVKDRSSDNLKYMIEQKFQHGYVPEVPDYTYDMHTVKGREMDRGVLHFLEEASYVTPELDEPWVRNLHKAFIDYCKLAEQTGGRPLVDAFLNTRW